MIKKLRSALLCMLLCLMTILSGCISIEFVPDGASTGSAGQKADADDADTNAGDTDTNADKSKGSAELPQSADADGQPYQVVNDNIPGFTKAEITTTSFEQYAELDDLGRCGTAFACVGTDLMPMEKRGNISRVKPTGWHSTRYDFVEGGNLYNRCHLIAYQLSGENANEKNLITGTRYMNVSGMLPFEEQVGDYVRETGNHVMYRVTPVFLGDHLIADGVQMEALSVEDDGQGVSYNVYVFNIQPGVQIDYATGDSQVKKESGPDKNSDQAGGADYVLNTNTKKFHLPDCGSAQSMQEENKDTYTGDRQKLIDDGYEPCGSCHP